MDSGKIAALPQVLTSVEKRVDLSSPALELPAGGGRTAAYPATAHAGLTFHEHFTFVSDTDAGASPSWSFRANRGAAG